MNVEAVQAIPKRKSSKRRNKKLLLLFIMFGFTSMAFIGITYAWFVGIGQVKVNQFTVNLRSENSLEISLDGYTWDDEISVDETKIKAHSASGLAYENNSNSWVGENGLVPVSSSGDNTNGRLSIYSKSSLTTSEGGYRLVAGQVNNATTEKNYYVAFDIFVKNKSGDVYNPSYNLLDDENIYLTSDSAVTGTASGATSYGVQNTARVAFVQVGRISLDDLTTNVTPDIKCSTPLAGDKYTPLCSEQTNHYRTMIWEPNDTAHDTKLVNYYNLVCHKRALNGITYTDQACMDITSGYVPTYTIKKNIVSADNVDIYDGLNYYTSDISYPMETAKSLQNTRTFTDTMKATGGEYTFMKLHPHSVTKIRVYVYIEGQDVDNYDLITNDLNITVNFGFTKERTYTGTIVDDSYFAKSFFSVDDGLISFAIDGTIFYAESGMTWKEWIDSEYNTDGYVLTKGALSRYPLFIGKYNSGVLNVNYRCDDNYLLEDPDDPDRYVCIFGEGSTRKVLVEVTPENYNQGYGTIIPNHCYTTYIEQCSGPIVVV